MAKCQWPLLKQSKYKGQDALKLFYGAQPHLAMYFYTLEFSAKSVADVTLDAYDEATIQAYEATESIADKLEILALIVRRMEQQTEKPVAPVAPESDKTYGDFKMITEHGIEKLVPLDYVPEPEVEIKKAKKKDPWTMTMSSQPLTKGLVSEAIKKAEAWTFQPDHNIHYTAPISNNDKIAVITNLCKTGEIKFPSAHVDSVQSNASVAGTSTMEIHWLDKTVTIFNTAVMHKVAKGAYVIDSLLSVGGNLKQTYPHLFALDPVLATEVN